MLHLWQRYTQSCVCFFFCTHARPCPYLTSVLSTYLWSYWCRSGLPHRDQKSPFTSPGISRWGVLISYRASDTSYLAGRLTCKGILRLDSSNECGTRAITWPTLHTDDEKSHLSFCDFSFSFVLPPITLFCLSLSLSWKLSPAMSGGGEKCRTAS